VAAGHPKGRTMKLTGEPNNWLGLGLILLLFVVIALTVHWLGQPKPG
jgi:hypothetical protein